MIIRRTQGISSSIRSHLPRLLLLALTLGATAGCRTVPDTSSLALDVDASDFRPRSDSVENLQLRIVGETGQRFSGELWVDGVVQSVEGACPMNMNLSGAVIKGDFIKLGGRGRITFKLQGESGFFGAGSLQRKGSRCRFGYHQRMIQVRVRR